MASQALRVLALAIKLDNTDAVEKKLIFTGLVGMIDPSRPEAKAAVEIFKEASVTTVMITGDHQDTAVAIAKELTIWKDGDGILTGTQLEKMDQKSLQKEVLNTTVYARVSPEHKLRIVDALKANDQVVAMTGDGVNDAPALKRADIGAAMGITGTEVAKEASDMVLLDDNFATIVNAVKEGRTIYANIRKSIQYLLSCNLGEIAAIFTAILLGVGSPLIPIQILWMNLVTDSLPALALGIDPAEKGVMRRKPRSPKEGVFSGGFGINILVQGLVIGILALTGYLAALKWGRTLAEAHTMAFCTISFSQLVHSFNVRSLHQSLFTVGFFTNRGLVYSFLISGLMQLSVVFSPFLRDVFGTAPLRNSDWMLVIGLSILPFVIVELIKLVIRGCKSEGESNPVG
jgi:Ca2+-transporting ATPase